MDKKTKSEAKKPKDVGLVTRHIFLDTEVYRRHGFNLETQAMQALARNLSDGVFVLHVADITLRECERQLADLVHKATSTFNLAQRKLRRWREPKLHRNGTGEAEVNGAKLAKNACRSFRWQLTFTWSALEHAASELPAKNVLAHYFARHPPFDFKDSKEFPDALVIEALSDWCKKEGSQMYVVTGDEAMQRAAAATTTLVPISSLDDLLQTAATMENPELLDFVSDALLKLSFDDALKRLLTDRLGEVALYYNGDWPVGEIVKSDMSGNPEILDFFVIGANENVVSALIKLEVPVEIEVVFENRSHATYDKEDDLYVGADESAGEFEYDLVLRLFATFDSATGEVEDIEIVTKEAGVSEPYETYK